MSRYWRRVHCPLKAWGITLFVVCLLAGCEPYRKDLQIGPPSFTGNISFHPDMGPDASRRHILYRKGSQQGGEINIVPVAEDGRFSIHAPLADGKVPSFYELYAFYDTNGNGQMDYLQDKVCYLIRQNTAQANHAIDVKLLKLWGSVEYTGNDGRYDLSAELNPPLLGIEDRSYWTTTYQGLEPNGDFSVFVAQSHLVDLRLYHVSGQIEDYSVEALANLLFPVRLAGVQAYSADTHLRGIARVPAAKSGQPAHIYRTIFIHRIDIRVVNPYSFPDHPLLVKVGQSPLVFPLHDENDEPVYGGSTSGSGNRYAIYFRDFDRTTRTDGLLNDESLYVRTTGYGPFVSVQAFIDLNSDSLLNPEDVGSNIFYYGDANGNGLPDRAPTAGAVAIGDFSDRVAPSYVAAHKDFTSDGEGVDLVIRR